METLKAMGRFVRSVLIVFLFNVIAVVLAQKIGSGDLFLYYSIVIGGTGIGYGVAATFIKQRRGFHLFLITLLICFLDLLYALVGEGAFNFYLWTYSIAPWAVAAALGLMISDIFVRDGKDRKAD